MRNSNVKCTYFALLKGRSFEFAVPLRGICSSQEIVINGRSGKYFAFLLIEETSGFNIIFSVIYSSQE
jgi:hypothetical protein